MKSCFGAIYPDLEELRLGKPAASKVFMVLIDSCGANHRDRKMVANMEAWEECQHCEEFKSCFGFSTAKLELQRSLREF